MVGLSEKAGLDDDSQLRPCEYFDLIAGSSTGGSVTSILCCDLY